MFPEELLASVYSFIQTHPVLVFVLIWFLYNKWKASQPWPDYGGRLTSIHSLAEWDALLTGDGKGKTVIIDAYATWCPPCKAAAPVYAKLSEQFSAETTVFAKVNVDEARDVAQRLEISAMPVRAPPASARDQPPRARPRAPPHRARRARALRFALCLDQTFKIFKDGKEVEAQRGWPGEDKIRQLLLAQGGALAKAE